MLMLSNWTRHALLRVAPLIFRVKGYAGLLLVAGLLAAAPNARAESLNNDYLRIFFMIQRADSVSLNDPAAALPKYIEARTNLFNFQRAFPNFNPKMVSYRLGYVDRKIASISAALRSEKTVPPRPAPPITPPPAAKSVEVKPVEIKDPAETNAPETEASQPQPEESKAPEGLPEQQ
jgi:hypothetical protein